MSRSYHATRDQIVEELIADYSDEQTHRSRVRELQRQRRLKRRVKRKTLIARDRKEVSAQNTAEAVPVRVNRSVPDARYPIGPDDIYAALNLLHPQDFEGLSAVVFNVSPQESLKPPEAGEAYLPDYRGVFFESSQEIQLFAYAYDEVHPSIQARLFEFRLLMMKTFAHELAHLNDWMHRLGKRGRWMNNVERAEAYAEKQAREYMAIFIPYLIEKYPDGYDLFLKRRDANTPAR